MSETTDRVEELAAAHTRYEEATARVDERGERSLGAVADAYDRATTLLDTYEGRATGTGDFQGFIEFQDAFASFVEGLDDDLPRREAFEDCAERFDKRRLSEGDFAAARDALSPAADLVARLDERDAAREQYRDARRAVRRRVDTLDERVAELERLRSLGEVDLDAPTERLRDPIDAYNDAVSDAFTTFRDERSARTLLDFVATTEQYPLVSFRRPPADLREYVEGDPAGTESVSTLLEYAEHSPSKLAHYVENPRELKRNVGVHRTYLERLDAEPLEIAWPPPSAAALRWRIRELVSVVGRFAPEATVSCLRRVSALTREQEYDRLRRVAQARAELTREERTRLAEGTVERDLEAAREERDRLTAALAEHPER